MSLLVRIIAPTGRDTELMRSMLSAHHVAAEAADPQTIFDQNRASGDIGPLLIAEEALSPSFLRSLGRFVGTQPDWSDLPILILTAAGRATEHTRALERDWEVLGSPVLLERPIRSTTLLSSVRAALRARERQYQIRDALAEQEHHRETLQRVLDNLPVGVALASANGKLVLENRRLQEIRHRAATIAETPGDREELLVHRPDGVRVRRSDLPLSRAIRSGQAVPAEEYQYQRHDDGKAWITISAAPILDEHGSVTGGVAAVWDIDQQKKSELALIQNEKLAAVGRLAASISHEINNPLEAVTNLLYLSRLDANLSPEVQSYLDAADHELARVSQIVSHTLRFHRQSTRPRSLSAEALLSPTLGLYTGRLANAGIQLSVEHRTTRNVICYEGEIRQVLNNLVSNAMEAMRSGGRLLVRSGPARCLRTGKPGISIVVSDTGQGISAPVRARLFEPFYTTKGENGTGLGLWISRGIVEKHQGHIAVRSTRAQRSGTVFRIFLPGDPFAA